MRRADLAITNLISNKREWNNCFIKFGTLVYLEIIAKFYRFLILKNDRKFMWQKQHQVGSYMPCARFVNLVAWKNWKWRTRVCWTKIGIIFNLRNAYQTKDIQPWSEGLKIVQLWVFEKSYNCALALSTCKNTTENFDHHVTYVLTVKIIFYKNSISVPLSLLWLPWRQFELDLWSWLQFQSQGQKIS